MTENFATTAIIREDATGPAGLVAGPFMVASNSLLLGRETLSSISRRDFWRALTETVPVLSGFSIGWECDVGNCETTELIFDALADPGRGTDEAGLRTWLLGRPDDVRRFDFIIDPVEGGHFEALGCAIQSAQLVMERGRIASWMTRWVGRSLTTEDSEPTATNQDNSAFAAAPTVEIAFSEFDGIPVFAGAISFSRRIDPAHYGTDSIATKWKGDQAVDVIGRCACRVSVDDFADMMMGEVIESGVTITLTAGDRVRVITIPSCRLEVGERTMVGEGLYEHVVQFAVVRSEGEDILSFTSEEP